MKNRDILCENTGRCFSSYKDYLTSDEWAERREYAIITGGRKCCKCGVGSGLQVHHKTYERIGNERAEDLLVVCEPCHKKLHNITNNGSKIIEPAKRTKAKASFYERNKAIIEKLRNGSPNEKHFKSLLRTRFGNKDANKIIKCME